MAELVGDREAAARGPLLALGGVDPDLALAGEEEAGEGLVGGEVGGAGGGGQVLDVADQEADVVSAISSIGTGRRSPFQM